MNDELQKQYIIAVGLDDSIRSWKAFQEAMLLAKRKNASLHIVSIQEAIEASYSAGEVLAAEKTSREKLESAQIKARLMAQDEGLSVKTSIVSGSSAAALVDYVKKNDISLLVAGDTGLISGEVGRVEVNPDHANVAFEHQPATSLDFCPRRSQQGSA